jgi:hypothetical protein
MSHSAAGLAETPEGDGLDFKLEVVVSIIFGNGVGRIHGPRAAGEELTP